MKQEKLFEEDVRTLPDERDVVFGVKYANSLMEDVCC